jgi:hypothetical protein
LENKKLEAKILEPKFNTQSPAGTRQRKIKNKKITQKENEKKEENYARGGNLLLQNNS